MAKNHGSSIKDDETYESLREDGYSKETAARIANAQASSDQVRGKSPFCAASGEDALPWMPR